MNSWRLNKIKKDLREKADSKKAKILQRFFKTGPGEYGAGDVFLGVVVPEIRKISQKYWPEVKLAEIKELLYSKIHEERLLSLLILVQQFQNENEIERKKIYRLYLKNTQYINNWDLVDLSADKIVGEYLADKTKSQLYRLAKSKNFWERRIAIMATFNFIKNDSFEETIKIAEQLVNDENDLIQKAVGWMLREVGKRDLKIEETFLEKHCQKMPRVMLRYAIEKFSETKRKRYLIKKD